MTLALVFQVLRKLLGDSLAFPREVA